MRYIASIVWLRNQQFFKLSNDIKNDSFLQIWKKKILFFEKKFEDTQKSESPTFYINII